MAEVLPCPTIAPISALPSISVTPTFPPRWLVPKGSAANRSAPPFSASG
jgi:hypothetical protein